MSRNSLQKLGIVRSETESYEITVYRGWKLDGEPCAMVRLDPRVGYDKEPKFFTVAGAKLAIEALMTAVGMAEDLL